eukprot:364443-Chlamydomonas_euryale.AAC.4
MRKRIATGPPSRYSNHPTDPTPHRPHRGGSGYGTARNDNPPSICRAPPTPMTTTTNKAAALAAAAASSFAAGRVGGGRERPRAGIAYGKRGASVCMWGRKSVEGRCSPPRRCCRRFLSHSVPCGGARREEATALCRAPAPRRRPASDRPRRRRGRAQSPGDVRAASAS